jgi:hypothetical protein
VRAQADAYAEEARAAADGYAEEVRAAAEEEAALRVQEAEWRVRRLQAMEIRLRQRLQALELKAQTFAGEIEDALLSDSEASSRALLESTASDSADNGLPVE